MTFSKVILTGEYSILENSMLIGLPYRKFGGKWELKPNHVDERLLKLCNHIANTTNIVDTAKFKKDILSGLYFDSTIPQGYGCGSSGALVAALYKRYKSNEVKSLIEEFSKIESFFHGKSSGLDPLISYYNKPILIKEHNTSVLNEADLPLQNFYLFDSKKPRDTKSLVNNYKGLDNEIRQTLATLTNALIESIVSKKDISKPMKALSQFQLSNMDFAIPKSIQRIWENGYQKEAYFKLCGAGGGGFFLVYSPNALNDEGYTPLVC